MKHALVSGKGKDASASAIKIAPTTRSMGLRVSRAHDAFEQEADRVADQVMSVGQSKIAWTLSKVQIGAPLQRKCACGGSAGAEGECEECKKKETPVQRQPAGGAEPATVPPIVHEVLRSPGQPLDAETRAFFEPRFGHDFSKVRVHADARAAESAQAVNALAYTVEHDIAFGGGQYSPGTTEGRRLLAHELAHTLQRGAGYSSPMEISDPEGSSEQEANRVASTLLSRPSEITEPFAPATHQSQQLRRQIIGVRDSPPGVGLAGPYSGMQSSPWPSPPPPPQPCLVHPDCSKPIPGSSWDFTRKAGQEQAETRKEITASPEKAKAAGAARSAVNLKAFANQIDPSVLSGIQDVVVNPAIGESAGAQASNCKGAGPESTGPACIEVPDSLERQAEKFNNTKDPRVGGYTRHGWQTYTLGTLTHEVEHTKFAKAPPVAQGVTTNVQKVANFSPDIFLYELGEMNSLLSEYPVMYAGFMTSSVVPDKDKPDAVRHWIVSYAIGNGDEDLRGMLKKLRCISPCSEVNKGVKKVFASQSAGWTKEQKDLFVAEVSDPKNGLGWPK